jgi:sec-independent protein translocase protein TatC
MKTFEEHTKELSIYLLRTMLFFTVAFMVFFAISPYLLSKILSYYAIDVFALTPLEFIKTQMYSGFALAGIITFPVLIYSIYLYCKEFITVPKIFIYIIGSYILGITGFFLGLTYISKNILYSLLNLTPIETLWSISSVSSIVITTSLTMAITLQLLLFIPLLMKMKLIIYESYSKIRKYFIVVILIILAMVTPDPTMFSTSILAIPVFGSVEGGFQIGRILNRRGST